MKAPKVESVYIAQQSKLLLGYRVLILSQNPVGEFVYLIEAQSGKVLSKRNHSTAHPHDKCKHNIQSTSFHHLKTTTTIQAQKLPEPLPNVSHQGLVHSPSKAQNPVLMAVSLPKPSPEGYLKNHFVDVFPATKSRVSQTSGQYFFQNGQIEYQEVMAYYHINSFQEYLIGLGFSIKQTMTEVVVNYGQADNSFFSPDTKGVYFGSGGIPDAEDADIIIHEYSHAIIDEIANLSGGYGTETAALHEGIADYLTASYFNNALIGEHDSSAYTENGFMRRVDLNLVYPKDYKEDSHHDGQIISGALWELRKTLGQKACDTLVLASLSYLPDEATFDDTLLALLLADESRFSGAHQQKILAIFGQRGIVSDQIPNARVENFKSLYNQ
jgi:hypothetical protein